MAGPYALDLTSGTVRITSTTTFNRAGTNKVTFLCWLSFPTFSVGGRNNTVVEWRGTSALVRWLFSNNVSTFLRVTGGYVNQTGGGRSVVITSNLGTILSVDTYYLFALVIPAAGLPARFYFVDQAGNTLQSATDGVNVASPPRDFNGTHIVGYESSPTGIGVRVGEVLWVTDDLTEAEIQTIAQEGLNFDDPLVEGGYLWENNLLGEGIMPDFTGSPSFLSDQSYNEYQAVETPTLTVDAIAAFSAAFSGSAFVGDNTHAASQWQVDVAAGDFSSPVVDSGTDASNLTSYVASGLEKDTDYKARVRYQDNLGIWSDWSAAQTFTTLASNFIEDPAPAPGGGFGEDSPPPAGGGFAEDSPPPAGGGFTEVCS